MLERYCSNVNATGSKGGSVATAYIAVFQGLSKAWLSRLSVIGLMAFALQPSSATSEPSCVKDFTIALQTEDWGLAYATCRAEAKRGDTSAQTNLGYMYLEGKGTLQDYAAAARWYQKAAVQGDWSGQLMLGQMYEGGKGVNRDLVQAHVWYNIAAKSAPKTAKAADLREQVAGKLSPTQVNHAHRKARLCISSNYSNC